MVVEFFAIFFLYLDTAGSNTWTERYFVLKDGFLLYYGDRKTPMTQFDMHPKGLLPLDGVDITTERNGPSKSLQSGIRIAHPTFGNKSMLLCAHNDEERDKWVTALQNSRIITYTAVATSTAQMEDLRKNLDELTIKYEKNEKLLAKRAEQVDKLVAQTRNLYKAIEKAENKYNIKIEVDGNTSASESSAPSNTVTTKITTPVTAPVPSFPPPPSTFMHPASVQAPSFTIVTPPPVLPPPPMPTVLESVDHDVSVTTTSSANQSRHSSIFDSATTTNTAAEVSNTLPAYVTAPPRAGATQSTALPSVTSVRPPATTTTTLPTTAMAPPRANVVPAPAPASIPTPAPSALAPTAVAPPRPGATSTPSTTTTTLPAVMAPPNKPTNLPSTVVAPPRPGAVVVPAPEPAPAPAPVVPEPVVAAEPVAVPVDVSSTTSTVPLKVAAPPGKPGGRTKTSFGQAMAPRN